MRMQDSLEGIALDGYSPRSPEECARRINAAAASILNPFPSHPVGGVIAGHLRLWKRTSPFQYNMKPVLAGRLIPDGDGTRFDLRYRAPVAQYLSMGCMGLVFLLFVFVAMLAGPASGLSRGEVILIFIAFGAAMTAFIWLMHRIGTMNALTDLDEMLAFLAEHAEARPDGREAQAANRKGPPKRAALSRDNRITREF